MSKNIYAIYKGDEFLFMGNIKECAKYLNVQEKTVRFYKTPYQKRRNLKNGLIVIKVDDIDE